MILPPFRYHPNPLASGSCANRTGACRCCGQDRGVIYTGPVFLADEDAEPGDETTDAPQPMRDLLEPGELDDSLCPWCIGDGSAFAKFRATFFDADAIADGVPGPIADEICQRTPGFDAWQQGRWPSCCGDAVAYLAPVGLKELRAAFREYETSVLSHIIHDMQVSGGAARRLLESLDRDRGPTAYLFRCLHCERPQVHLDYL